MNVDEDAECRLVPCWTYRSTFDRCHAQVSDCERRLRVWARRRTREDREKGGRYATAGPDRKSEWQIQPVSNVERIRLPVNQIKVCTGRSSPPISSSWPLPLKHDGCAKLITAPPGRTFPRPRPSNGQKGSRPGPSVDDSKS